MNNLVRTVAPTVAPVDLNRVKAHLNIWHNDDDTLLAGILAAAIASVEGPTGIGIALTTQTWAMTVAQTVRGPLYLDLGPVQSVTSVEVQNAGEWTVLDGSAYRVMTGMRPAQVTPVNCWPCHEAIRVTFKTGFGDAAENVPADLVAAILLTVGYLYENRAEDAPAARAVEAILARYR